MQRRPISVVAARVFFFSIEFAAVIVSAQMVGSRDLTSNWRAPSERISVPQTCAQSGSSIASDGSGHQADANSLELAIVAISPSALEIGNDFTATVRLKNAGQKSVLVPSTADGEQVARISSDGTEEKYEVGDISFRLVSGKDKDRRTPVFLNSSGALFADPDDNKSYVSLGPGNWLDIKLKTTVECGLEECLGGIQPDNHAVLTAWWYQRVLTHKIDGCDEKHGSFKVREVNSAPFLVAVRNSSSQAPGAAPQH